MQAAHQVDATYRLYFPRRPHLIGVPLCARTTVNRSTHVLPRSICGDGIVEVPAKWRMFLRQALFRRYNQHGGVPTVPSSTL